MCLRGAAEEAREKIQNDTKTSCDTIVRLKENMGCGEAIKRVFDQEKNLEPIS